MNQPKVSVIMPMYNAERYVAEAIDSVLGQTFGDFEFIIINDGSTDNSADIVRSYKDSRIILIENKKNTGLVEVRNRGIKESRAPFIAMLDSDDITHRRRFEYEVELLGTRPEIGLVATWVRVINESGVPTGVLWKENSKGSGIPARLLFGNCISQSSVMVRRSILPEGPYRPGFAPAEDYDLWVNIAKKSPIGILHTVLTDYRSYGSSISALKKDEKEHAVEMIIREQLGRLDIIPTPEEYVLHRSNFEYLGSDLSSFILRREAWLKRLVGANEELGIYSRDSFKKVVGKCWLTTLTSNAGFTNNLIGKLFSSELNNYVSLKDIGGAIGKITLKKFFY